MASQLTEDRTARKVGTEPETYQEFEVNGNQTVYTNSIVGIRADDGTVEPVNPANFGSPGYNAIGFTEDHSEPDSTDEVDVGDFGSREVKVQFGVAVELGADIALNGDQDVGKLAYPASDHQFDLTQDGSEPALGPIRELLDGATDRAIVDIRDLPDQA